MEHDDKELIKEFVKAITRTYVQVDKKDLRFLVQVALCHEEITLSKAAELLGLTNEDIRKLLPSWMSKC